ncbi:bifunctional protein FolD [Clostridia bacterium]|nr:bifunctional protein FolD [Clostridia bacterium]
MAEILYGKNAAAAINEALIRETEALKAGGTNPTLAIVRVGARGDDVAYERGAVKRCEMIGIDVKKFELAADVSEEELLKVIAEVNGDAAIHGCLLFRPLPKGIDETRVCGALAPEKDVDGITAGSILGVFTDKNTGFAPCTAQACIELLNHYGYELKGKKVVVVGRSLVIGKPVAMMALARHATVTICHSRTEALSEVCRTADILIAAAGKAGLVDASGLGPDTVVIDVGINVDADGNMSGDVRKEDAEQAGAYSPVPGGVGAVTTSVLAKHVVEAAARAAGASL